MSKVNLEQKKVLWEVIFVCFSETKFYLTAVPPGPQQNSAHTATPQVLLCFQKKTRMNVKEVRSVE